MIEEEEAERIAKVYSDVHEHELKLEVMAMAAETSDAQTMAMWTNESRQGDGKYWGFTDERIDIVD